METIRKISTQKNKRLTHWCLFNYDIRFDLTTGQKCCFDDILLRKVQNQHKNKTVRRCCLQFY